VPPLSYGRSHGPHLRFSRRRSAIRLEERETGQAADEGAVRSLYGIDGPRRRPTPVAIDAETVVIVPEAPPIEEAATFGVDAVENAEDVESVTIGEAAAVEPAVRDEVIDDELQPETADAPDGHPSIPEMWRGESFEHAERRRAAAEIADLEERFDTLRIELEAALDRRIRVAVDQMQITFDQEIEALRTVNREEAKRVRSANDEAFVRIRVANTAELDRVKAAIDEGVARLCGVLEGQLDRIWAANDVELERIRSAGADRLAEVHDLLTHQLDRLREERSTAAPEPAQDLIWNVEPATMPEVAEVAEEPEQPELTSRRWLRRGGVPASH